MKLADLRKIAVRQGVRIRFSLPNGMECVLNEHGVAQLPGLRSRADFSLEEQLDQVAEFIVEPASARDGGRASSPAGRISSDRMAALAGASPAHAAEEHDE